MARKPKPQKPHFPTPEERDERHKIENVSEEDALKILLGSPKDRELDEDTATDRNEKRP